MIACEVMLGQNSDLKCNQRWVVEVTADTQTEAQLLEVTPQDPVRGRVWGVDGVPAEGVIVGHHWKGGTTFTDADGQFELPKTVISPAATVAITAHDMIRGEVGVATITRGESDESIELHMLPAGSASGIVIDEDNQPISDVLVQLVIKFRVKLKVSSYIHARDITGKDGTYSFSSLAKT